MRSSNQDEVKWLSNRPRQNKTFEHHDIFNTNNNESDRK